MVTKGKKVPAGKKIPKPTKNDLAQYAQLRTLLDSLEIGALRFYLDGTTSTEKKKRFGKLRDQLMPIIVELWGVKKGLASEYACPDGYTNCNGCCVPYNCCD